MSLKSLIQADSPWGLWTGADTAGTTATDQSGNSHDGTLSGGVSTTGSGAGILATQAAWSFDGTGTGVITIPPAGTLPAGDYTLVAVLKVDPAFTGNGSLVEYGVRGTTDKVNAIDVQDAPGFLASWYGNDLTVGSGVLTSAGHLVIVTFDGTTRTIWLDGASLGNDTPGAPAFDLTGDVLLGNNAGSEPYRGLLDMCAILPSALSSGRIAVYQTEFAAETSAPSPPSGLSATYNGGTGHIDLAWTASGTGGVTYTLLRSTTSGAETSYVTGISGTSYSDTSLASGTTYYYTLEAVDGFGASTPTSEVSASTPTGPPRTVQITGTAIDGGGNPNPTGIVGLHLLVPGGGNAIHTATGDLINRDPPNPVPNATTAVWTAGVIAPGDITPPGCVWQVSEGAAQPIISPSFAWTSSTINVTSWIGNPSRMGLLKMFLTAIEGNALIDAGATFGVTISGDATWTGTGGAGQLIQAGAPPIQTTVDSFGDVYYYLIPMAALTPVPSVTTSLFYQSPTRTGQLLWTCPAAYTDDQGTYAAGTTYDVGDVVRDPANNYEPYISLVAGNIGNTPSASPTQWADYAGESITAHLILAATAGQQVAGTANIAADAQEATGTYAVPAVTLQDQLRQLVQSIPGLEYRLLKMPAGPKTFGAYNVFF